MVREHFLRWTSTMAGKALRLPGATRVTGGLKKANMYELYDNNARKHQGLKFQGLQQGQHYL